MSRRNFWMIAAAVICCAEAAYAEDVQRLRETSFVLDETLRGETVASAETGWAKRGQLVWVESKRDLERRVYEIWRGPAEKGLTFRWKPDEIANDSAGRVSGSGHVTWRPSGVADYDTDAIQASYRGEMLNGRRHGSGTYRSAVGFSYDGEWRNGQMHGVGEVAFANGDHYIGTFRNDRLHGKGRYIDSEGVVFEGSFFEGQADGEGKISRPDDLVYHAVWHLGKETKGTRVFEARPAVLRATLEDDFRVGVTLDSPTVDNSRNYGIEQTDIRAYKTRASGETLIIEPASERIMNVWSGTDPIDLASDEEQNREAGGGFLGVRETDLKPIKVIFDFDNRSRSDVRVVRAEIAVEESRSIMRPMLQVSRGTDGHCNYSRPFFDPAFRLENFGWAPLSEGTLSLNFKDTLIDPIVVDLAGLMGTREINLQNALSQLGANTSKMREGFFGCGYSAHVEDSPENGQCFQSLRQTGAFGALANSFELGVDRVFAPITGKVSFSWRTSAEKTLYSEAFFTTKLSLGTLGGPNECGEGGRPSEIGRKSFSFLLDKKNYKIEVKLRDTVPAGVTARWRIPFEADRNSFHRFRILFELSDGRYVPSRPIELTYLRPRVPK